MGNTNALDRISNALNQVQPATTVHNQQQVQQQQAAQTAKTAQNSQTAQNGQYKYTRAEWQVSGNALNLFGNHGYF